MMKSIVKFILLLLMVLIVSCGEDQVTSNDSDDNQNIIAGGNSKAGYSGITEVDEGRNFKTIDPGDWRDDGILVDCLLYPNPVKRYANLGIAEKGYPKVLYTLLSDAYVAVVVCGSDGTVIPWITRIYSDPAKKKEIAIYKSFTLSYPDRKEAGGHWQNFSLVQVSRDLL